MKVIVKMGEAKLARVKIERPKINPETEKRIEAAIQRSKEDLHWIFANEEDLISKYNRKFIAVQGKKVVFVGQDFRELLAAIKAEGKDLDDFTIKHIKEKPMASLSWKSEQ